MNCQINVNERIAIVTGGAQGIGWSIAQSFAASGAKVIIADIAAPSELKEQTADFHYPIQYTPTDITNEESVENLIDKAVSSFGRVDILVNNAGIMYKSLIEDFDMKEWHRVQEVNVTGAVICAKKVASQMKKQMWGRIINMSSMQTFLGSPTYSVYTASKAALSGLTKVWAAELAPYNVTVNSICPSYANTPMMENSIARMAKEKNISKEEAMALFVSPIPQKRILETEEIAFSILFLSSPLAQGITGHDLVIAAGMVMR